MKKALLALTAAVAFTGSAYAADLPARMPMKAAPPIMAPSWTGFYIFGGVGGGIWDADTFTSVTATGVPLSINQRMGGDGWFGTVGAGYDWQFNSTWVAGIFADGQFGSLRGSIQDPFAGWTGTIKMQDAWAAGVRLGYLVAPNVLSYVNGGYSGSHWSGSTFFSTFSGLPVGDHTNSFNRNGFFIGGGVENNLNIFGITAPGWFMKTEYRSAYYGSWGDSNNGKRINELVDGSNALVGRDINFKPWVQTVSTSLVYRFNWTGPVVAKY
jgi:outer membrane immunogenic protein